MGTVLYGRSVLTARLIYNRGTPAERTFELGPYAVIGRGEAEPTDTRIEVSDTVVSKRHCIVTLEPSGRAFIRDVSRNGTRVSGRRLQPNLEVPLRPGDEISIAPGHHFVVELPDAPGGENLAPLRTSLTVTEKTPVTIVVGDVSGYTVLNQQKDPSRVYPSLRRIMDELERAVVEHDGSLKEYQGDAIFAYWEGDRDVRKPAALDACKAVLSLHARVIDMAADPSLWSIEDFPLRMEWAVTSGEVLITTLGADGPKGMAMIGDPVNRAFAIEKLATPEDPILLDDATRALVESHYVVRGLGRHRVRGRREPEEVHALIEPRD